MGGLSHIGHSISHAASSVTHSVGHATKKAVHGIAHDKIARTVATSFITQGNPFVYGYSYLRGVKDYHRVYQLVTGHYARQMKRAEKDAQEYQRKVEKEQEEYNAQQRVKQVDELRERIGVGTSRYRTKTMAGESVWGSARSGETLG